MMKCVHGQLNYFFHVLNSSFNRKTKHSKALQIRLQLFTLQLATVQ